ncbi:hypothetical protein PGTUg99_000931 [Puccinia graminis f. sp. tritici]|uniref:Uncharacterized protein n=1 Tax=Puccinia graminis f. sp. tritici TaxID=56615 RepID=A0A5B0RB83_PUCGR|nr:hypothetical protein PGTUg99_001861 [Puccinia graminis f. sp. tritici]KAA1122930.1 hypothetical protein PGTUg99_000931 [Puccinia graminis f. sp. tritici]
MSTYQLKTVPLGPLSLSKTTTTTSRLHSSSTTNQSSPIPSPNQASDQHQPADHLHLIQPPSRPSLKNTSPASRQAIHLTRTFRPYTLSSAQTLLDHINISIFNLCGHLAIPPASPLANPSLDHSDINPVFISAFRISIEFWTDIYPKKNKRWVSTNDITVAARRDSRVGVRILNPGCYATDIQLLLAPTLEGVDQRCLGSRGAVERGR